MEFKKKLIDTIFSFKTLSIHAEQYYKVNYPEYSKEHLNRDIDYIVNSLKELDEEFFKPNNNTSCFVLIYLSHIHTREQLLNKAKEIDDLEELQKFVRRINLGDKDTKYYIEIEESENIILYDPIEYTEFKELLEGITDKLIYYTLNYFYESLKDEKETK